MIRRIVHSALFRNVGKLLSANVLAQVIGILVYPVLTRIYRPEDFALFNLFVSIAGVLTLIATAEYHYAIVLPKSEQHAKALTPVAPDYADRAELFYNLPVPADSSAV